MRHSFLYPAIVHLPRGYDCQISYPAEALGRIVRPGKVALVLLATAFHEGQKGEEKRFELEFEDGQLVSDDRPDFRLRDPAQLWPDDEFSAFLEISVESADGEAVFSDRRPVSFYSIFFAPGRKSFFQDCSYKYGSPPTIAQIASLRTYADQYAVVHVDRAKKFTQSFAGINPYGKPILATLQTHDGRKLPRMRIPPGAVRWFPVADLLLPEEETWEGRVQLTANNRMITFVVMHQIDDRALISDHEHLDPFRGEPTHSPLSKIVRKRVGHLLKKQKPSLAYPFDEQPKS